MLTIPNVHHGYAATGFVGRVGGLPQGTFGLKVLKGTGLGLDLWKSYLADSAAKSEGPAFAGLGGFGSTSSLAGWVGQLCQVSGNLIASVDAGFSGFRALGRLDKVWHEGGAGYRSLHYTFAKSANAPVEMTMLSQQ